jgi:hypothetical protein
VKVAILAGGVGSRLAEEPEIKPKPHGGLRVVILMPLRATGLRGGAYQAIGSGHIFDRLYT